MDEADDSREQQPFNHRGGLTLVPLPGFEYLARKVKNKLETDTSEFETAAASFGLAPNPRQKIIPALIVENGDVPASGARAKVPCHGGTPHSAVLQTARGVTPEGVAPRRRHQR